MARVDFPLHCYFELNRRQECTISIVQVRERYTDGRRKKGDVGKLVVSNVYRDKRQAN